MSTCQICGADNARWTHKTRQALCADCAKDTPEKVGFATFVAEYFDGFGTVDERTAREFYHDYLASTYDLAEYTRQTTSVV